jgi:hypothetical protein
MGFDFLHFGQVLRRPVAPVRLGPRLLPFLLVKGEGLEGVDGL